MKTETLTFTETIEKISIWLINIEDNLASDWIEEDEKELMIQQHQQLLIAKANLDSIMKTGGQIFNSAISK